MMMETYIKANIMEPEKYIKEKLEELEKEHEFKVLFAIESGSRAWGMESEDSDYDVRFVYVRPKKDYLSLVRSVDNVNWVSEDKMFDIVGFDIYKYCGLIDKSNPNPVDWLLSPIEYFSRKLDGKPAREVFKEILLKHAINYDALFNGYWGMCKSNYYKYCHKEQPASYKNYLYALRGLCNALWIDKNQQVPPTRFEDCYKNISLPPLVLSTLNRIIAEKKSKDEGYSPRQIVCFDDFIEDNIKGKHSKEFDHVMSQSFDQAILFLIDEYDKL